MTTAKHIPAYEKCFDAASEIVAAHDARQRKHACPGFDCSICSLHADESQIAETIDRVTGATKMREALEAIVKNQGIGAAGIAELALKEGL